MLLKIGILHEGPLDAEVLKIVINKIAETFFPKAKLIYQGFEAKGQVITKIKPAFNLFFSGEKPCGVGVVVGDKDKDTERLKKIKIEVASVKTEGSFVQPVACGCPDPTIEQWLISEANAIRQVLQCNLEEHLNFVDFSPKDRIKMLHRKYNKDETRNVTDMCIEAANLLNLEMLQKNDSSFKSFIEDFISNLKKCGNI
jgi:hypothetical protein